MSCAKTQVSSLDNSSAGKTVMPLAKTGIPSAKAMLSLEVMSSLAEVVVS